MLILAQALPLSCTLWPTGAHSRKESSLNRQNITFQNRTKDDYVEIPWDENLQAKGLSRRVSKVIDIVSPLANENDPTPIKDSNSPALKGIKKAVNDGHAVVFMAADPNYYNEGVDSFNNHFPIIRANVQEASSALQKHALTIVGYDDDYLIRDANGAVVTTKLKGAFKVINSFGTTYKEKGYAWIMYDAFNPQSIIPELNGSNYLLPWLSSRLLFGQRTSILMDAKVSESEVPELAHNEVELPIFVIETSTPNVDTVSVVNIKNWYRPIASDFKTEGYSRQTGKTITSTRFLFYFNLSILEGRTFDYKKPSTADINILLAVDANRSNFLNYDWTTKMRTNLPVYVNSISLVESGFWKTPHLATGNTLAFTKIGRAVDTEHDQTLQEYVALKMQKSTLPTVLRATKDTIIM